MITLSKEFKNNVITALLEQRKNYDGSDNAFSKQWSMNNAVYSRLKSGEREGLLKDSQWLNLGRELGISMNERKWNMARTDVFTVIEEDVMFCQNYAKGKMYVDDCGIGKTFSAKYLSRTLKNCFYVDGSQAKTKQLFIRLIAKTIGVDDRSKYSEVKANIKYYLKLLPNPMVIIDEAGDLEYTAFLELKELWNATEGACGWYLIGAEGLRAKIEKGMNNKKVGFKEMFSRYSEKYSSVVPRDRQERIGFYRKLITDVLSVNMSNKDSLGTIVKRCLTTDESGHIGGLRRAESLLILNS
jgi:hypothetical protein